MSVCRVAVLCLVGMLDIASQQHGAACCDVIGQDILVEYCKHQANGSCCMQNERVFAGNWMYKHIDTSMAIRKRGAALSVPWPLDDRLLFKATQDDNKLYEMVNFVNTILRYEAHLLKQIAVA